LRSASAKYDKDASAVASLLPAARADDPRWSPHLLLLNALSSSMLLLAAAVEAAVVRQPDSVPLASCLGLALCALTALERRGVARLSSLEERLGVRLSRGAATDAPGSLAARLSGAACEADALRVACNALHDLFPGASAQAVAVLQDSSVIRMEVAALTEAARQALLHSLPCTLQPDAADTDADAKPGVGTAASFVCCSGSQREAPGSDVVMADSADWPAGTRAFTDWAAALDGGCAAGQLITARLVAGTTTAGFVVLAFPAAHDFAQQHAALRSYCTTVGAAVVAHRCKDAAKLAAAAHTSSLAMLAHDHETAVSEGLAIAADVFPQHIVGAMAARARRRVSIEHNGVPRNPPLEGMPEDLMTDSYECGACGATEPRT
jgi:hypothetical protein